MLVFDSTALIALFEKHPIVWAYWQRADRDELTIAVPATAIAEANQYLLASSNGWFVLLDPPRIEVVPLDEQVAIELGGLPGSLAARHALWEAMELGWILVTREPEQYPRDMVPLLVI